MADKQKILLIYTGGTIGMVHDHDTDELMPFSFDSLLESIPELKSFDVDIDTTQLSRIIDSSNMRPELWIELTGIIELHYENYDGFVILHGTDTLAYTSSVLSYMIQGLNKPVVLTGSQLPIGIIRTDGKENLITAIEVASTTKFDQALVPEVSVYFEYSLMRGNRVTKYSAEHFDAFDSPNYPNLAEAGVEIEYNHPYLRHSQPEEPVFNKKLNGDIAVLKLFPGIQEETVRCILSSRAKGIVMETFGAGNAPTAAWFIDALKEAVANGKTILNITQCLAGAVEHGRYATSSSFEKLGIISGGDMTFEAGVTKLMHVLGNSTDADEIKELIVTPLSGERD
jgi:L-asparaginase